MSDQVSEFHVAQHSRRERLRITSSEELDIIHQYGNISYDPSVVLSSSEMINFATTTTGTTDVAQNCSNWRSLQHSSCGWNNVTNFNSSGSVIETNNYLSPMFVGGEGGVLSGSLNLNSSTIDVKPNFYGGFNEMHQSIPDTITSNAEFSSSVLYHDTLQEVVKSATKGNQRVDSWIENESYVDQSRHLYDKNCGLGTNLRTNVSDNSSAQGLALSLSPVPRTNTMQMEKRNNVMVPENFAIAQRSAVPLGPFTGYATILKSSQFLRPAQQLLDELCDLAAGSSNVIKCSNFSKKVRDGFRVSCDVNAAESSSGGGGGVGDSSGLNESNVCPEYLQKKAKLIFMQEEICKRYKQYHQQMQMVVSSFETVAGLSAATPYISLALKTVAQHFKSLRNTITDHLKNIRQALGEDLPSPASGMSNKGDGNSSRLKFVDQTSLHKQKSGSTAGVAFLESQQHVWRPQRGLPERAVAILRAWLFDHFLHPYPTDSDKHMLASQTGLTRNQVSNWFINARVRVWKPMVEEIHMLETKGGDQTRKSDVNKLVTERTNHVNCGQHLSNVLLNMSGVAMPEKQEICHGGIGPSERLDESSSDHHMWRNQEKRSRIECHHISDGSSMDGSLMGFVPYQRNGLEIGGNIGAVSLTLGLRQNAEAAQQQQQLQLHEHRLRQQFGGHIIHDFVD
ncbi:BEL1-like homeodomain protein 8 [Solanum pennellii]|uniref:BEL1-like homeodomain protein 8 n=1 Tax=Solanum pennellii TaxID=28526 RepID=A0ABM1FIK6_SOLPN|nr:BEL1-like homeodomain protein 8 [Solanum pennellii]